MAAITGTREVELHDVDISTMQTETQLRQPLLPSAPPLYESDQPVVFIGVPVGKDTPTRQLHPIPSVIGEKSISRVEVPVDAAMAVALQRDRENRAILAAAEDRGRRENEKYQHNLDYGTRVSLRKSQQEDTEFQLGAVAATEAHRVDQAGYQIAPHPGNSFVPILESSTIKIATEEPASSAFRPYECAEYKSVYETGENGYTAGEYVTSDYECATYGEKGDAVKKT